MKKSNLLTGVFFLALSVFAYTQTFGMVSKIMTDELGPGFWPKCLSVSMGALALVMIAQSLFGRGGGGQPPPIDVRSPGFRRVVKLSLVLIVFGAIVYVLGIFPGILFMMPLCMLLHGERNIKIIAGLTVGMCLFIYLIFGMGLRVPLPMGLIFS